MKSHLLALLLLAPALSASIPNSSFEDVANGKPNHWRKSHWQGEASHEISDIARTGRRSILINADKGSADVAWSIDLPTEPRTRYHIEAWVRTENVKAGTGKGALLNLHSRKSDHSKAVTGTSDWTKVALDFDSGWDTSVQLNCLLGYFGSSTGKAWFDDLTLTVLGPSQGPDPKPAKIAIDLDSRREPIPELIYAQFIEHLGRCIYGGIWAEMFEDRKFYHSVGSKESPWRPVGDGSKVTMSKEPAHLFVGDHSPLLSSGGIEQAQVGIRAGITYVGYAWVKTIGKSTNPPAISLIETTSGKVLAETSLTPSSSGWVESDGFAKHPFVLSPSAGCDDATFRLTIDGPGSLVIGTLSLMPDDHVGGMRADTLALLKELNAPAYRWPGGNFVSGYDWRDGIGDRDRRPPRKNPAWKGVEHNDFGMHEFISFCRKIDTEPVIAVNTGFGDAYSCAAQLEYVNGAADTPMGKLRASNGDPEPWNVKQWCIGNEMWGAWQLGYMKREHYGLKQNWVVDIMRKVDPDIHEISSGDMGAWTKGLMVNCADHMDSISEHFYCQERKNLIAHVRQMTDKIRERADYHRELRKELPHLNDRDIRIAMDEWNYWYGPHVFGELGTRYFLKDAVGIAAGLHEFARHTDIIESAFYAQTVNVIGCIKTTDTDAAFATTGLVLKLYREHFLGTPVATTGGGTIDAQAAVSPDGKTLVLGVANLLPQENKVPLSISGGQITGNGRVFTITGSDPMDYNEPGAEPKVIVREQPVKEVAASVTLPPHSASLYLLELR